VPEATASGQWTVHLGSGVHRGGRGRTREPSQQPVTRAAPTVTSRSGRWMLRPQLPPQATRVQLTAARGRAGDGTLPRDLGMPSHTVMFGHAGMCWADPDGTQQRITVAEAGILQSFPVDYPWQGGRNSQYRQAGDAFPPLAAAHVLAAVTGIPAPPTPP
jgi:DNA (cytosine-5)-methyltransferase 1